MMPLISNGRWDNDAPRRSAGRHAIVRGPVRQRRAVPGVPVQGALAGWIPVLSMRPRRRLRAQDQDRLRVRGLPQAALLARRHHLRADQDGLGQVVPGDLPGEASKGGIAATELKRQLGLGSYQTAWTWLHKLRKAMVRPDREPLAGRVEADETYVGGPRPGKRGGGAAGKALVGGAVEAGRGEARGRRLGRLRLAPLADASAESRAAFLAAHVATPATVATDGWRGYLGLPAAGYDHEPANIGASRGDAALRLPAIHLVFSLVKRWLLGTHHGAVGEKHLPAYLDEYAFRFNRRTAKRISHGFARLIERAVKTKPTAYREIIATPA